MSEAIPMTNPPADELTATCPKCNRPRIGSLFGNEGPPRGDLFQCGAWQERGKELVQSDRCKLTCANQQIDELKGKLGEIEDYARNAFLVERKELISIIERRE